MSIIRGEQRGYTQYYLYSFFFISFFFNQVYNQYSTDVMLRYNTSFCLWQDFLQTVLDVLTPDDVRVLAQSENELSCRGQFERIFPSPSPSRYLRFFEGPRYLNILLDQWEQKHWNNRLKGFLCFLNLIQKIDCGVNICDNLYHLYT